MTSNLYHVVYTHLIIWEAICSLAATIASSGWFSNLELISKPQIIFLAIGSLLTSLIGIQLNNVMFILHILAGLNTTRLSFF